LLADEYGDKISIRIFDNSVEGQPEISLEQLEEKGIPDYEELRKRANEVLGQYDGRASVDESGESGTSKSGGRGLAEQSDANRATKGGGRSKVLRPIAEPSVEAPNGCKDEGRAAETVSGDAKGASDGVKGGEETSFKLESATAEEIKGAEPRRKERAGIKKRQNAPIKMKNAAEESRVNKLEDNLAALFYSSEFDTIGGNDNKRTKRAPVVVDLQLSQGRHPRRLLADDIWGQDY
jgi:hypothetical protein